MFSFPGAPSRRKAMRVSSKAFLCKQFLPHSFPLSHIVLYCTLPSYKKSVSYTYFCNLTNMYPYFISPLCLFCLHVHTTYECFASDTQSLQTYRSLLSMDTYMSFVLLCLRVFVLTGKVRRPHKLRK